MDNNIEKAKALYESRDYDRAFDICINLLKAGECKKDAYLLAAKSFLFKMDSPMYEEHNDTWLKAFGDACSEAETVEEALELERDMLTDFTKWKKETIEIQLAVLENNPTLEQWKSYIPILVEYSKLVLFIQVYARNNCSAFDKYCAEKGIEKKQLGEKLEEEFGDRFEVTYAINDKEIKTLEYEVAQRLFADAQEKLAENCDGNGEFIKQVVRIVLQELIVAQCIIRHSLPKKEDAPDVRCERLIQEAEIKSFVLSAMVYPNGMPLSLFMGNRENEIEELKEIYTEIKELDPTFVAPGLPSVEAVTLPQQSGGGGCYVATAVYGSYDCPEVWTLRRFRDYTLAETWYGRAFIHTYYAISPTLVKWFGHTEWFRNIWKPALDKMVEKLNTSGVENTPYNDRNW